ncbi:pyruvate dehydrogenase complex dihydrolipoamide acetyltransferase component (E2) [Mortierella polycephala]|uniref:Acetyltransferase component of pyruvate dehydrogenase complex n=1 Tax=Mortierella polycephala TaxID=41804 RepID=A0A9P6PUH7_9FUNG|nr:pyruvate dehydrogenase complex dihydrolipoamide acetyltransferase component (E2) [Mortierella polycephala]
MISSISISRLALATGRRTVQRAATLVPMARAIASHNTARSFSIGASAPRHILAATSVSLKSNMARFYSSKSYPSHITISMPALSPTMTSGNIGTWQKKVGDAIAPGDVLVEIETDKAQMDFECQEEGFIAKILADSGAKDVNINHPIAIMVENKEDIEKFADFTVADAGGAPAATEEKKAETPKPAETPKAEAPKAADAVNAAPSRSDADRIFASPLAKKIANEKNISLSDLSGSGPHGRIVKADVESYTPAPKAAPAAGATTAPAPPTGTAYTDIPLTNMRKIIAQRLTESKQNVPHYYVTVECEMDKVMKLREVLNKQSEDKYRLSVNDFIVKASALALKAVPEANSSWMNDSIRQYHTSDICVATSTPAGLITPIVANAESKGLATISNQVKDLAARARANKLAPHEYQGGTFTISNMGMYGIKHFTAIINPPQSCILAVGATEKRVVPGEDGDVRTASIMAVTLSSDHRTVDGAVSAQFLNAFKGYLENPLKMLL